MAEVTLTLTKDKEVKNSIRFKEARSGQPPIIGTVYIQKWFAGDAKTVTITLSLGGKK